MIRIALTILAAVVAFVSCGQDMVPLAPEIVVEGYVQEGISPYVLVHEALTMGDDTSLDENGSLASKIITWAKVTLYEGTDSVVMVGKKDPDMRPPYKYVTSGIIPRAGETYRIKVEYSGRTLTASTTLPAAVPIDSVKVAEVADSVAAVTIFWTDPSSSSDYYCAAFKPSTGKQWIFAPLSATSDEDASPDGVMSLVVIPRNSLVYKDICGKGTSMLGFRTGIDLDIRLSRIDKDSYRFWKSYTDLVGSGTIVSDLGGSLQSNVSGGSGIFSGLGSSVVRVSL